MTLNPDTINCGKGSQTPSSSSSPPFSDFKSLRDRVDDSSGASAGQSEDSEYRGVTTVWKMWNMKDLRKISSTRT